MTPKCAKTPADARRRTIIHACLSLLLIGLIWLPGTAQAWWNDDWAYRKPITVDAGTDGAGASAEVKQLPVLIRLHEGIFNFTDAQPDGSDLRFIAGDDKTPLTFHVEKFDPAFNLAYAWVQIPDLSPDKPQKIYMYYGNPKAEPAGAPAETYGSSQTAVYHFNSTDRQRDVTQYKNNPSQSLTTSDGGLIWYQGRMGGSDALVVPASPSTAVAAGGAFTWSAWVKLDDGAPQTGQLLNKSFSGGSLSVAVDQGSPYLSLSQNATTQNTSPSFPIDDGSWHQIAVVGDGSNVTLYVDGRAGQPLATALPALNGQFTVGGQSMAAASAEADGSAASDAGEAADGQSSDGESTNESAGDDSAEASATTAITAAGLSGYVDEINIAKVARSQSWLALEVNNQGSENTLLTYGNDQENAGWGAGYLGVLLGSVTVDGWVVIAILMVMAVISWIVMVQKGLLISRVQNNNEAFMDTYRAANGIGAVQSSEIAKDGGDKSPLNRLFQTGLVELKKRMSDIRQRDQLSQQSIEAIRSELYAQLILENQRLNKRIVLLTIAISGGPFLGLLGTVVGVMITFAAIAENGQVDVASIAPGIAAALVATVAGLAVAIPALFGYNYLITRIKEIGAQLEVFLDEFVTRLAESYDKPDELGRMAGH